MSWFTRLLDRWRRPVELPNPLSTITPATTRVDLVTPYSLVYTSDSIHPQNPWTNARAPTDWTPDPTTGSMTVHAARRPDLVGNQIPPGAAGLPDEILNPFNNPHRRGIKPPEEWTWAQWQIEAAHIRRDGWQYVRFANRTKADQAAQVFGWVHGHFGVYLIVGEVQYNDPMRGPRVNPDVIFACLTHLPTGTGVAVFDDEEVALDAAELAERMSDRWDIIIPDEPSTWSQEFGRIDAAWKGVGIHCPSNARAIIQGKPCLLFQRYPDHERPERLS